MKSNNPLFEYYHILLYFIFAHYTILYYRASIKVKKETVQSNLAHQIKDSMFFHFIYVFIFKK